jgi:hypothetical protein
MTEFSPVFVIPTRNRAELARNALASVRAASDPGLRIWVSDNSTETGDAEALKQACESTGDARLRYLRPPRPLPMGQHWEWILRQALADGAITHVCFLTDRMIFIPGALDTLMGVARRNPERLIAYPNDHIDDLKSPVVLNQHDWTGRVVATRSTDFLRYMRTTSWTAALPRLLNCMVPCSVLRRIDSFYGTVCDSASPDVCFAFRALEREDAFLYIDQPLIADYALTRSNGHSAVRGAQTKDHRDYMANLGSGPAFFAAPMPGVTGMTNAVVHEYNLVRMASGNPIFRRWNLGVFFKLVEYDLRDIENPEAALAARKQVAGYRQEYRSSGLLRRDQWRAAGRKVLAKIDPGYLGRKLVKTLSQKMPNYGAPLWRALRVLGVRPFAVRQRVTQWPDSDQALLFLREHPLPRQPARSAFEYRVRGRCIELAD